MKSKSHRKLILLTLIYLWASWGVEDTVWARRGGGFSRSFSSSSRGLFRSSRGSSSRMSWGSKSSGYVRKGGIFGSSKKSSRGKGFQAKRSSHSKIARLSSPFSLQSRKKRQNYYQQNASSPRTVINKRYYPSSRGPLRWGASSVGIWDLYFLSTMTHHFWYHHWHDQSLQQALYRDNLLTKQELKNLEQKVAQLENDRIKRDPNYLPEGATPEVAYSKDYQTKQASYSEEPPTLEDQTSEGGGVTTLSILFLLGAGFYLFFLRKY